MLIPPSAFSSCWSHPVLVPRDISLLSDCRHFEPISDDQDTEHLHPKWLAQISMLLLTLESQSKPSVLQLICSIHQQSCTWTLFLFGEKLEFTYLYLPQQNLHTTALLTAVDRDTFYGVSNIIVMPCSKGEDCLIHERVRDCGSAELKLLVAVSYPN